MMLTKYNRRTVDENTGSVVGGAIVNFYVQGGGPANVYSDVNGSSSLGSEIPSDPQGRISVFMHPGLYRITVTVGGSVVEELTYVAIYNVLAAAQTGTTVGSNMLALTEPNFNSFARINTDGSVNLRTFGQVKQDLDLDQVDNTPDADKPISYATLVALADKSNVGHGHNLADSSEPGFMSSAEHDKLDGIAAEATANAADSFLLDRANHTGQQSLATISDAGNSAALDVGTGAGTVATGDDARFTDAREWTADTVGQIEAEEGTSDVRRAWTAERDRQATVAWWSTVSPDILRTSFGDTASRPTPPPDATWVHFDTDLGHPVFWDGDSDWVDATGVSA